MTTDRFDKLWGYFFGLYERIFDEGNSYDDSIAVISLIIKNFWDANYENKLSENPNTLEKLVFNYYKMLQLGAVVVAQLEERLLPIPEVFDSNPVIGKNLY